MSLTTIVSKVFLPRQKNLERHYSEGETLQRDVLMRLVGRGKDTEYGRQRGMARDWHLTSLKANSSIAS